MRLLLGVTYFACDPLRPYYHEPQKNEIYFLNESSLFHHSDSNWIWTASWQNQQNDLCAQQTQISLSAWRNIGWLATHSWLSAQQTDQSGLIWDFAGSTDNFVFNWSLCCSCLCMSTVSFCAGIHTFFYNIINFKIRNVDLGKDRIFL